MREPNDELKPILCPLDKTLLDPDIPLFVCPTCGFKWSIERDETGKRILIGPISGTSALGGVTVSGQTEREWYEKTFNVKFTDEGWEYFKKHKEELAKRLGVAPSKKLKSKR